MNHNNTEISLPKNENKVVLEESQKQNVLEEVSENEETEEEVVKEVSIKEDKIEEEETEEEVVREVSIKEDKIEEEETEEEVVREVSIKEDKIEEEETEEEVVREVSIKEDKIENEETEEEVVREVSIKEDKIEEEETEEEVVREVSIKEDKIEEEETEEEVVREVSIKEDKIENEETEEEVVREVSIKEDKIENEEKVFENEIEMITENYNNIINDENNKKILENFNNFKNLILKRYTELNKDNLDKIMKDYEKLDIKIEIIEVFLKLLCIHLMDFNNKIINELIEKMNELSNIFNTNSENYSLLLVRFFKDSIIKQLENNNVKRKFTAIIVKLFDYDKYLIYLLLKNNINPINWFLAQDKQLFKERNIITDHDQIMKLCKIQIHPSFINNLINLEKIDIKTKNEIMKIDLYKHLFTI